MPDSSPIFGSVAGLISAYRQGELSPVEVVREALDRIEEFNPQLNAYLSVSESAALSEARAAEAAYLRGDPTAPLLGIPIGIKDLFGVRGMPTTLGSLIYRESLAAEDSEVVARLRAAGAVLIGKTNTAEFGQSATTENLLGPGCANPWDPTRTAGGSSGGAAAAVSAGLATMALGSDGGGSIRIPAAMCGLFGIKPSLGRVPDEGPFRAMTDFACPGPIVRRVADARPFLEAVIGESFDRGASGQRRIAWCPAPEGRPVNPGVADATAAAAALLADLGHDVEEAAAPIAGWKDAFGPLVLADEWRYRRELLDREPGLLTDYARRSIEAAGTLTDEDVEIARRLMDELRARMSQFFERFDFIVTPATATPAFPIGERPSVIDGQTVDTLWGPFPFTAPFNVSGSPAASVPCGFTGGLPVGLQVVAAGGGEAALLDLCEDLEGALGFPAYEVESRWRSQRRKPPEPARVVVESQGDVTIIRIDRPAKRNALTREMLAELRAALAGAVAGSAAAVVLTGTSDVFSAGVDLTEVGHGAADTAVDDAIAETAEAIKTLAIPVVAAIEGACIGAAIELAVACDARIAGADSYFQLPAAKLGLVYRPGGVVHLVAAMGAQTTARLLVFGDRISATDALPAGVIGRVVPAGDALESAVRLGALAGESVPEAASLSKRLINEISQRTCDLAAWETTQRGLLSSASRMDALARARSRPVSASESLGDDDKKVTSLS
jgi:Asp-tRNA(Asn)/Glu-tRNA(Gln) amidotransferase A subunit family amidase/enoyl-CoA hydratase/carnithine racemase